VRQRGRGPAAVDLLETAAGPVGVIGLTSPNSHRYSRAPAPAADRSHRVQALAGALRGDGARWVVALLHDGVEWWPANPVATRSARLEDVARSWAGAVDLILGGHNFAAWAGALAGTPAGEPHVFGASVVVVDLADRAVVRGVCHRRAAPRRAARRHAGALGDGRPRQPRRRSRVVELVPHARRRQHRRRGPRERGHDPRGHPAPLPPAGPRRPGQPAGISARDALVAAVA
jgi:hypothetical protein